MASPPLSHQELLELVAPLVRAGLRVDLAASHRDEHRVVLRRAEGAASASDPDPGCDNHLELDASSRPRLRLRRTVRSHGAEGRVTAVGRDPLALLAAVLSIPADRVVEGPGPAVIARAYEVEPGTTANPGPRRLMRATIRTALLEASVDVPEARGLAAEVSLKPAGADRLDLPEDLLAVLGWNWARLVRDGPGWATRLRLRGPTSGRTVQAERAVEQLAAHLVATLSEPAAAYHPRQVRARWAVFARRAIPTATAMALLVSVGLMAAWKPQLSLAQWIALYHVPTLIVAASFMMQELPRFEVPPWPRPLAAGAWPADRRDGAAAAPGPADPAAAVPTLSG
jgi:hypothetical protein